MSGCSHRWVKGDEGEWRCLGCGAAGGTTVDPEGHVGKSLMPPSPKWLNALLKAQMDALVMASHPPYVGPAPKDNFTVEDLERLYRL